MDAGLFFELAPNTHKPRKSISFSMIFAYHACCAQNKKNNQKSLPATVGQSFPQVWRLNPVLKLVGLGYREVWDTLWCLSAGFGALMGGSWLLLGSPEQALGTYLAALGHLLAGLGRHLEGFWSPGPPRALILKGFGVFRGCVFRWFLLLLALCYLMLFLMQ